ncbi:hypothetical protein G6W57_05270 [Streptomyces sp. CAI-121]|uniref:hypothetical protein n=1 Tax=unclassified Streptomyces TaxID=2593676 RepID=UPI0015879183|nr:MULTISPECIES: hypothetical protein [unclassified Streptomyces]NUV66523.1 hypothetical protein [Streptomyces sp. CAI-121]NUW11795.1 hypothetical protein [Streptomyces sp. CAI-68]
MGIILAVFLIAGVAAAVALGRDSRAGGDSGTAAKTVRGVIGSEKAEFFADPDTVKALAAKGFTVRTETSGSWAMDRLPLKGYDFAFPGSKAPADELSRSAEARGAPLRPFYSPLVVVAHRNAAEVLAANGLARLRAEGTDGPQGTDGSEGTDGSDRAGGGSKWATQGTLLMGPYLAAAEDDRTWQQLKGASGHAELSGTVFITSTDPVTSNSGALYLAAASYVADGGRVATDARAVERTAPLMRKLVQVQGAQQTSSDAPFRDFISGVGNPLVLVYESQVASLLMSSQRQEVGDLVVLYPDTTVSSDHTLVPLTDHGRELGELLSTDPVLRKLAVRHGFRPQGAAAEFTAATAGHTAYIDQRLTGVRQAPVPTAELLRSMARQARG